MTQGHTLISRGVEEGSLPPTMSLLQPSEGSAGAALQTKDLGLIPLCLVSWAL